MTKFITMLCLLVIVFKGYSQESSFSEMELMNFQLRAQQKAEDFSTYIGIIASKTTSLYDKEEAIYLACALFIHDTVTIQVSYCPKNGVSEIVSRTLIDYLRRLSWLDYDYVTIEWVEFAVIGNLKKGPDGRFHGLISYVQIFRGTKGDYTYEDKTMKHIEVVLDLYRKFDEAGEEKWEWDVFLSNINIKEPCL